MATHLILQKIFKTGFVSEPAPQADLALRTREQTLHAEILKIFGQSVAIRHVDAGSCNGCELEIHAINGPHYNIEGMGVKFVASPAMPTCCWSPARSHATSRSHSSARTMPHRNPSGWSPWAIAAAPAACLAKATPRAARVSNVIPVDVEVPGCPPTPIALLQGILAAVSKGNKDTGS